MSSSVLGPKWPGTEVTKDRSGHLPVTLSFTAGSSLNLRLPAHVNICTQNFSLKESSKNSAIKTFLKYVLCSWINSSDVQKKMTLRQNILISSISMISVIRTIVVGCKSRFQFDKTMIFLFYSLHNSDNRQYSLLRTPHNYLQYLFVYLQYAHRITIIQSCMKCDFHLKLEWASMPWFPAWFPLPSSPRSRRHQAGGDFGTLQWMSNYNLKQNLFH